MTTPLTTISGLASNIQWRDIVDTIGNVERTRYVLPLNQRKTLQERRRTAYGDLQSRVQAFADAARTLRDGTAFRRTTATGGESATTGRQLVTTTTSTGAEPGLYRVEVRSLATAEKLGSRLFASDTTALGLAGTFTVGGRDVVVAATDTLATLRTRLNEANTGATPSGVGATILGSASTGFRLVLTSDAPGETGIALGTDADGIGRALGFQTSQSRAVSSSTLAIAAAMGVTMPPPSSIRVGDQVISVDLATESLSQIAAKIRAAGQEARVDTEAFGETSRFRLRIGGAVSTSDDPGSQAVLDALGITVGGREASAQQVRATGVLGGAGGAAATTTTALTDLTLDGVALAAATGDAIAIRGVRGDGSTFRLGITIDTGETIQTLLTRLNASDAFGGGRTATASLGEDGRIEVVDNTTGESRLSLSLELQRADDTTASFGTPVTTVAGRARQLAAGTDAVARIDGVEVRSSSNSIASYVPGVTFTLDQAEPGTTVEVRVSRDEEGVTDGVNALVSAYNDLLSFYNRQSAEGQPLQSDPTARSVMRSLTTALRAPATSTAGFTQGAQVGLALQRDGTLKLDNDAFLAAFRGNLNGVVGLFGSTGIGGNAEQAGNQAVRFGIGTIATTVASIDRDVTGIDERIEREEDRIARRQEQLVQQYTRLETALTRLQRQSGALTGFIAQLNAQRN